MKTDDVPWKAVVRRESGLVELVCKCGVGHPAWGSVDYLEDPILSVHGCCGCCQSTEWKIKDLKEGLHIANTLIKGYQKIVEEMRDGRQ